MTKLKNRRLRRVKKVLCWRILSFTVGSAIGYLYLGEFRSSVELTAIMTFTMASLHYMFEAVWDRYDERLRSNTS